MVKQQNLEKIAQFFQEFSKNSAKNHFFLMEFALEYILLYYFPLNYFKHLSNIPSFP